MKMQINPASVVAVVLVLCNLACSKKNDTPSPVPVNPGPVVAKNDYSYSFLRKDTIDFKVYAGSAAGGQDISATYKNLESVWGGAVQSYMLDSLQEIGDTAIVEFRDGKKEFFISNVIKDSLLYRTYKNGTPSWAGFKKGTSIELVYTFRKAIKIIEGATYFTKNGGDRGIVVYKQFFNDVRPSFASPAEMTNPLDTVIWYNVKFVYKRK